MKPHLEQDAAQRLLHLTLAGDRLLPAVEADEAHYFVDLGDDALNDHRRFLVANFLEECCERGLSAIQLFDRGRLLLGLHDVPGQREKLLQELDTGEESLLVALP